MSDFGKVKTWSYTYDVYEYVTVELSGKTYQTVKIDDHGNPVVKETKTVSKRYVDIQPSQFVFKLLAEFDAANPGTAHADRYWDIAAVVRDSDSKVDQVRKLFKLKLTMGDQVGDPVAWQFHGTGDSFFYRFQPH